MRLVATVSAHHRPFVGLHRSPNAARKSCCLPQVALTAMMVILATVITHLQCAWQKKKLSCEMLW